MRLEELGLPPGVVEVLKEEGITSLYPPQEKAVPLALKGRNLFLAVPTASGKSLVAYLAALRHVLERGGKALYIVPLRALAAEKFEDLSRFEGLGVRVGISVGDFDSPDPELERYDIIIATSEKADSLLRHRSSWLQKISLVVADEVHLIHDPVADHLHPMGAPLARGHQTGRLHGLIQEVKQLLSHLVDLHRVVPFTRRDTDPDHDVVLVPLARSHIPDQGHLPW